MSSKEITSLDCLKHDIVQSMFIKTADENYVVARWCSINRLHQAFFWNTAQAVEKYLKAALLLNGRSSIRTNPAGKEYGHDISLLFENVMDFAGAFIPERLSCPDRLSSASWTEETTKDYIDRINDEGHPDSRYNVNGFRQINDDLYKLDIVIFHLRRIAAHLDGYAFIGSHKTNGGEDLSYGDVLRENPLHDPYIMGSHIQNFTSEKTAPEVREAFLKHNLPFSLQLAPEYDHGRLRRGVSVENSALYLNILHHNDWNKQDLPPEARELAQWILDNIKLGKGYKALLKGAVAYNSA